MKFESGLRNTLERLWNPLTLDAQMLCALQWLLFRSPHVKLKHTAGGLSLYDFMLSMVLLWHHYHRNQWPDWYLNHHQPVSFQILDQLLDQRSAKKQLTIVPHDIPWSLPPPSFCARLASKMGGPLEKNNGMRKKPSNSGCPQSVFLSPFRLLRRPGAGSLRSFTRLKGTTTGNHGFIRIDTVEYWGFLQIVQSNSRIYKRVCYRVCYSRYSIALGDDVPMGQSGASKNSPN